MKNSIQLSASEVKALNLAPNSWSIIKKGSQTLHLNTAGSATWEETETPMKFGPSYVKNFLRIGLPFEGQEIFEFEVIAL